MVPLSSSGHGHAFNVILFAFITLGDLTWASDNPFIAVGTCHHPAAFETIFEHKFVIRGYWLPYLFCFFYRYSRLPPSIFYGVRRCAWLPGNDMWHDNDCIRSKCASSRFVVSRRRSVELSVGQWPIMVWGAALKFRFIGRGAAFSMSSRHVTTKPFSNWPVRKSPAPMLHTLVRLQFIWQLLAIRQYWRLMWRHPCIATQSTRAADGGHHHWWFRSCRAPLNW